MRELGNVLDRAVVMDNGAQIEPADLVFDGATSAQAEPPRLQPPVFAGAVRVEEQRSIACALAEAPSRRATAERLGIMERTLR